MPWARPEHFPVQAPRLGEIAGAVILRSGLEESVDVRDGGDPCRSIGAAALRAEGLYYCEHRFFWDLMMTTRLEKTLKRQLTLDGRTFIVTVPPELLMILIRSAWLVMGWPSTFMMRSPR